VADSFLKRIPVNIFGLEVRRVKAQLTQAVQSVGNGGWFTIIREGFAGAFSRHVTLDSPQDVLAFSGVFAPITLIAGDVAKLRVKLVLEDEEDGICTEVRKDNEDLATLARPNHYQNRIQFWTQWILSKLLWGNTYVLKIREKFRVVALYILDPSRVKPLVATNGDIYYELSVDNLSTLEKTVTVPATEIIHDRWNCLWHPLVGVSPLYACAMSATQGRRIQNNSTLFFENSSRPSGILITPGKIDTEEANEMKRRWEESYGAGNTGRTAVLGNGLKFETVSVPAQEAQLIEQLDWTKYDIADCFHVPHFKVGGEVPAGSTIEALNLMYYSDCLQTLIEAAELCMDEGLELEENYYTEFDLDGLLRMDQTAQMKVLSDGVKGSILAPNEARAKINQKPVKGGESPMAQQQNYSLEALSKRDAKEDPFETKGTTPPKPVKTGGEDGDEEQDEASAALAREFISGLMNATPATIQSDSHARTTVSAVAALAATVAESQRRVDSTLETVVAAARSAEKTQERIKHSLDSLKTAAATASPESESKVRETISVMTALVSSLSDSQRRVDTALEKVASVARNTEKSQERMESRLNALATIPSDSDSKARAAVEVVTVLATSVTESQKRVDATLETVAAASRRAEMAQERVVNSLDSLTAAIPSSSLEAHSHIQATVGIVTSLAARVAESQKQVDETLEKVIEATRYIEKSQERVSESLDKLGATLRMPVVPIFDKKTGMLKGSKRVESLEE
jgi:HK97 family phage portal protein